MKVLLEALKNAKKRKAVAKRGAPQPKKAIPKKSCGALGDSSASARAPTSRPTGPTATDDDKVKIVLAPTSSPAPVPLVTVTSSIATSRQPSPSN